MSDGSSAGAGPVADAEARLLEKIDERTDRTRRALGATIGNGLLVVAFIVLPRLPGAPHVFAKFDTSDGLWLSLPALCCVVAGAVLYRRLGPRHPAYRALDAVELAAFHAFPALFPVLDDDTTLMSGGFLIVSATFWAQGKPARARLYGAIVGGLGLVATIVFAARGQSDLAAVWSLFASASVLAYVMTIRVRLEGVLAEVRQERIRAQARELRLERERQRIGKLLAEQVGVQLDGLVGLLEQEGLPEAQVARRLSDSVAELVLPASQPVEHAELVELVRERCRALFPSVVVASDSGPGDGGQLTAHAARATLRIAQELVRNAVVHGRARTIEVTLSRATPLVMTVSDDGVGLTGAASQAASGGLGNARAWLAETGGTLRQVQREGFSTSLRVELGPGPSTQGAASTLITGSTLSRGS